MKRRSHVMLSPAVEFYLYTVWWQGWITGTSLRSANWNPGILTSSLNGHISSLKWASGPSRCLAWWRWCWQGEKSVCGAYQVIITTVINTRQRWNVAAKPLKPHSRASGAHSLLPTWGWHVSSRARVLVVFFVCLYMVHDSHIHRLLCVSV